MKVIAFNGSPRRNGNTSILIHHALEPLKAEGIETEVFQLGGNLVRGCTACYQCRVRKNGRCAVEGDVINECIDKIARADGVILASPTYFADVTAEMKALIDRVGFVARATDSSPLRRKVGAAIVAVRRGGSTHAFDTMNHFFLIQQMIVPGSYYWNMGMGMERGEVLQDEEGLLTMKILGENMAWLLKKIAE